MADAKHVGVRTADGVRVRYAESTGPSTPSIVPTSPWPESVYAFADPVLAGGYPSNRRRWR